MQTGGFANAPVSQFFLYYIVLSSVLVSIADVKYLFHIQIVPHLWRWRQWWRLLIWQGAYANAGEVLFGTLAVYNLRVIERLWGSRKFASFLTYTFVSTSLIAPLLLGTIFRPLTIWRMNYLPPGPTPLIFAILAQYHATIPSVYKFRLAAPLPSTETLASTPAEAAAREAAEPAITLSDKFYVYIIAAQLAFCQPPGSLLGAAVGWTVGYAWRADVLPWARFRVPGWMFGKRAAAGGEGGYEGLRRVARGAEEEAGPPGMQQEGVTGVEAGQDVPGRPLGTQLLDQFRGAF